MRSLIAFLVTAIATAMTAGLALECAELPATSLGCNVLLVIAIGACATALAGRILYAWANDGAAA